MFANYQFLIALIIATSFGLLEGKSWISRPIVDIAQYNITCPEPCFGVARCNIYANTDLHWALDGNVCKVFNGCTYFKAQCQRQNNCLPPLIYSTKDECQEQCATDCDLNPLATVCAWFPSISDSGNLQDNYKEFNNQCELDQWTCINEKPYVHVIQAPC